MTGDDTVVADDAAVHDGGIDADQTVIADGASVNGAMMGDGAVRPDD